MHYGIAVIRGIKHGGMSPNIIQCPSARISPSVSFISETTVVGIFVILEKSYGVKELRSGSS